MSELDFSAKLVRLCRKIGEDLTEPFETKLCFRQGDTISCDLFNIIMEIAMLLADADDIFIICELCEKLLRCFRERVNESELSGK